MTFGQNLLSRASVHSGYLEDTVRRSDVDASHRNAGCDKSKGQRRDLEERRIQITG